MTIWAAILAALVLWWAWSLTSGWGEIASAAVSAILDASPPPPESR